MITQKDKILARVEKPTRYTGGELNEVLKNPEEVDVRFGFVSPTHMKLRCRIWELKFSIMC